MKKHEHIDKLINYQVKHRKDELFSGYIKNNKGNIV